MESGGGGGGSGHCFKRASVAKCSLGTLHFALLHNMSQIKIKRKLKPMKIIKNGYLLNGRGVKRENFFKRSKIFF